MSTNPALLAVAGAATTVGAVYGTTRLAAWRLRSRPAAAPDGFDVLAPIGLDAQQIPSHDGGTINYVRTGSGRPLILSHGVTLSVRTWAYQLHDLPEHGFEVIAFDHRGHGASAVGEAGHSVTNLGTDVRTLLETLDLRDAILVGHSMGGIAVQSFLIDHPDVARERVAGIVLLSTLCRVPLGSQSTRAKNLIRRLTRRTPDTTWVWRSPNLGLVLARLGFGRRPQPDHMELVRRMMLECPVETRHEAPRALVGLNLAEALRSVDRPTMVVCGSADTITPPSASRLMVRRIPDARLEVVAGAGHMVMLERRAEFERLLVDFATVGFATSTPPTEATESSEPIESTEAIESSERPG